MVRLVLLYLTRVRILTNHRLSGNWLREIDALHARYGDFVRIGPNELSCAHPQSIKDIYGQPNINHPLFFRKSTTFYKQTDRGGGALGTEVDPHVHQGIRKLLSPGFSASTLRTQSDIVIRHINSLIDQMSKRGNTPQGMDVSQWYMWLAFDVIADLSFGEELGTVEMGQANEWVHMLANSGFQVALDYVVRRRWKCFQKLVRYFFINKKSKIMRKKYLAIARQAASQRIQRNTNRTDFFSHLLREKAPEANIDFFTSQSSNLIAGGTETTSALLSAVTYYLLKHPQCLKQLQEELRYEFQYHSEINGESTKPLKYLNAVIEEGLRIFGTAVFGLPRVSPGSTVAGKWVPKGTVIATATNVISSDERWFYKAKEFHPERWLPADHPCHNAVFNHDHKEFSRPFSIGTRSCIAVHLSYMEVRICIAKVAWSFDWEQANDEEDFIRDARMLPLIKPAPFHVRFRPSQELQNRFPKET
ncbi:cytochrome P450 monooxygenase [Colletotrichum tofieldiae]|uniref:Cytochrome P450 monooxygenase n=1 Tax=Colletotrichum tofieldiae TaxID=708197 RepID=A0A166NF74_9PEZI|nr:cytochrome P450 monooxygenase [Colletotrichum tofieldiae]